MDVFSIADYGINLISFEHFYTLKTDDAPRKNLGSENYILNWHQQTYLQFS